MEGAAKAMTRAHNERAWLAWHTAGLGRARTFPRLERLQIRDGSPAQSRDQMISVARAWDRALASKR